MIATEQNVIIAKVSGEERRNFCQNCAPAM